MLALVCWLVALPALTAQTMPHPVDPKRAPARQGSPQNKTETKTVKTSKDELQERIEAAQTARGSGDAETVSQANRRLIGLALRQLAQLRRIESAYRQASELYNRSLPFEDIPEARLDLATSELESNQPDDALRESGQVLGANPRLVRALNIQARAWVAKGQYAKAVEALERSEQLEPDVETLYSLGSCLLEIQSSDARERSGKVFAQMIKLAGDSGSIHIMFGRAYREANDMPSAIREFERAVSIDPRTPHAYYFLALARLANNEWKATEEIKAGFMKELEFYPRDYLANYMVGFIASSERNYPKSDKYLEQAVDINPDWPEPWLYMGLNAYERNDLGRAETMFRKAIELTGEDLSRSNFEIRRAYIDLGRILTNSGRRQEAEAYLAKARDLQKKVLEDSQRGMAEMVARGGAGSAAAIVPLSAKSEASLVADPFAQADKSSVARSGLTLDQRSAADAQEQRLRAVLGLAFNDLATSEAVQKQYATALTNYQEAERWDPTVPELAKNLGLCAFRNNDYTEAIRGLSKALEQAPGDKPVRAMLGMAYFGAKRYRDAVDAFRPLGAGGMQDAVVGYAWASSLAETGELKTAAEVLGNFEQGHPTDESLLMAGKLWIEIGDYSRAVSAFHRALDGSPSLRQAHYFAGQADIRWEHWGEAAQEFRAELELDPSNADAKYNLGFVYLQQSETEPALALFEQVVSADPNHANAQYQLGKILLDRGRLADAVEHLEAAARLNPKADYVHYQLQAAYRKLSRIADADRELAVYKELKASERPVPAGGAGRNP